MGTEAVLYRTASGQVRLAEAYCPHLGAHIGLGGAVRGELIQCPFHGLGFGADGQCVSSPDGRPPRTARLRMFDTREVDGVIVAYYDPGGQPAEWWIESRARAGRWPAPTTRTWRFRGHPQEVSENSVDLAHLLRRTEGARGWKRLLGIRPVTALAQRFVACVVAAEINRDIPIWQHKRYLDRPALCPGEGSIGRYRKWARQFYAPLSQVPASRSEPTRLEGGGGKGRDCCISLFARSSARNCWIDQSARTAGCGADGAAFPW